MKLIKNCSTKCPVKRVRKFKSITTQYIVEITKENLLVLNSSYGKILHVVDGCKLYMEPGIEIISNSYLPRSVQVMSSEVCDNANSFANICVVFSRTFAGDICLEIDYGCI